MVDRIYPAELQLNKTNFSDAEAPFFNMNIYPHLTVQFPLKFLLNGTISIYIYIYIYSYFENLTNFNRYSGQGSLLIQVHPKKAYIREIKMYQRGEGRFRTHAGYGHGA